MSESLEAERQRLLAELKVKVDEANHFAEVASSAAKRATGHANKADFWVKVAFACAIFSTIAMIVGMVMSS